MQKTRRLDRCPRRAVAAIGGVPRLIVRDKAKVVVIKGLP
jgi:hypothetical protein